MVRARKIALKPPDSFAMIIGNAISGWMPATKPRWLPNVKAALTENAIFTIFPRGSMSLVSASMGITWASVVIRPAVAVSLMSSAEPIFLSGRFRIFSKTKTIGKAPARKMAMVPTILMPSSIGIKFGITMNPVNVSMVMAISPTTATSSMSFPK